MTIKNQKLHDVLKEFSQAVAYLLIQKLTNITPPVRVVKKISIEGSGRASYYDQAEPDLGRFYITIEKEILALPQTTKALEELQNDSSIAKHINQLIGFEGTGLFRLTADDCLRRFLFPMLNEFNNLTWNEQIFEKYYLSFEDAFYSDVVQYRSIAPLENFSGDFDEVDLGNGLKIIKADKKCLEEIWERGEFNPFIDRHNIWTVEYVIQLDYSVKKIIGEGNTTPIGSLVREQITDVVTALRVFKPGMTGFNFIESVPLQSSVLIPGIESVGGLSTQPYRWDKYSLTHKETSQVAVFFKVYKEAKPSLPNYIIVAIKRLEYAYARLLPQDKLLDYMIAFEALFLKGDEEQELSYRLSLRSAYFIGSTTEERKSIFEFIKNAYRVRSKTVHGDRIQDGGANKEFVQQIEDKLRESIKKILANKLFQQSHKDFIKGLDDSILG